MYDFCFTECTINIPKKKKEEILRCLNCVFVYPNDVCIESTSDEVHQNHLHQFLQRLPENNPSINVNKSELDGSERRLFVRSITVLNSA